jgi:Flp pilus assembly protein TadD
MAIFPLRPKPFPFNFPTARMTSDENAGRPAIRAYTPFSEAAIMRVDRGDIPAELNILLDQGQAQAEEGDLDAAIKTLRSAAEQFADQAMAHYYLSVACLMKLKGDLDHIEWWENLADDEGLLEVALFECETAVDLAPELVPALNNLGILYALRGRFTTACEQWERSLSLEPDQPRVRQDLAVAREKERLT